MGRAGLEPAYQIDETSGDAIIEVEVENHPVKGKLVITKKGEVLTSFDNDFVYEAQGLAGAEFAVYAAEDIFTPDHQKDENGDRIRIYEKDSLVTTVMTDEAGTAEVSDLPLGTYRVIETKAPEGFVLNTEPQEVIFAYQDQKTPVIEHALEFTNDRQKVEITVEKQDMETGKTVEGAVFGIYAAEDIHTAAGTVLDDAGIPLVEADTLLAEGVTGKNGILSIQTGSMHRLYPGFPMIHFILNFPMEICILRLSSTGENIGKKTEGLSCL